MTNAKISGMTPITPPLSETALFEISDSGDTMSVTTADLTTGRTVPALGLDIATGSTGVAAVSGAGSGSFFGIGPAIATDTADDESSLCRVFLNDSVGTDNGLAIRIDDDGNSYILIGDGAGDVASSITFLPDGGITISGGEIGITNGTFSATSATVYDAQGGPVAQDSTTTLLAADMLSLIVTSTSASAVALTLPTGTDMDAAINDGDLPNDNSFDWSTINLGSAVGVITLTANTDHTIVGNALVPIAAATVTGSALWRTRKTAANTFVTYRIG